MCRSQQLGCFFFILCCGEAVQLVFRYFSEGIVAYVYHSVVSLKAGVFSIVPHCHLNCQLLCCLAVTGSIL